MTHQGCNLPHVTGRESALTNAKSNSDNRGSSSRSVRCRKSGRRATKHRLANGPWAARGRNKSSKASHDEVVSLIRRRSYNRKHRWVSDEEVASWIEEEKWETEHIIEMMEARFDMDMGTDVLHDDELGSLPETRPDGIFRALSVQLNGMSTSRVRNRKAAELQAIVRKYDVQFVGIGEVGVNWDCAKHTKRLLSLLPDLELGACSKTAHNALTEERLGAFQQGGVGQIYRGEIKNFVIKNKSSKDFRHLGRWISTVISGRKGHNTRIIHAYAVRPNRSKEIGSVYQQHLRYMQRNGFTGSPRDLFVSDLLNQLQVWRAQGDRLILMMDANEHVLTGKFCRRLIDDSIGLREITKDVVGSLCPNTHGMGSIPIDGVWATSDITVTSVKWLSLEESPGDHRACIFDFTTLSAVGTEEKKIVLPDCRRLTSSNKGSVINYTQELEQQFKIHRIEERLARIERAAGDTHPLPPQLAKQFETLDQQVIELQRHAEKGCRKIYRGEIDCSPQISLWHKRERILGEMIKVFHGKIRNTGVLYRKARKLGIQAPSRWSLEQVQRGRQIAKAWKRKLGPTGAVLRMDHLGHRLLDAIATEDEERAAAIRAMMDRESSAKMWATLAWAFKDNGGRGNAVTRVERREGESLVQYTEQQDIERVVQEETQTRFTAAESSPFCQGLLREQLGYMADTETAASILNGTFTIPTLLDDTAALLIQEIGRVGQLVSRGCVRMDVSAEEFSDYWRHMKESTSSSMSGVHFGHYVVAGANPSLSSFFARKISLVMRSGTAPSRWGVGLTVLLEKIAGVALVNKLRAILLMEADFNMHNRLIFGNRMMEVAREHNLIPDEQFAERESDGQDGAFLKRLLYDFSRLMKVALGIVSADAANCYDRVAHPFASLVFQSFGVFITSIIAMLGSIQRMKFFLRTAFGVSPGFMTAVLGAIIQGLCQGNAASPAGWSVICAILISVYRRQGHGAIVMSPMRGEKFKTAGVLFVDDVDLSIMDSTDDKFDLWEEVTASTLAWSRVLIGSGGTAKGEKCFGYVVTYEWDDDGNWHYGAPPTSPLQIVNSDGVYEDISLLPSTEYRVTLGIASSPDGSDAHHLQAPGSARDKWKSISTRAKVWLDRLKNAHIPAKYAWVSYRLQLWASVRYGLGVLSSRMKDMSELCHNFAFLSLPYFGINRNIKAGWRYIHSAFGGAGLINLTTETVIARLNLFLQHWDNPAPIGQTLRACMQALQLQCGCVGCPLSEPFYPMGEVCDHSWLTSFWEVVDRYKLHLFIDYEILSYPRENDDTIMRLAIGLGYTVEMLRSINRCRLAICALFLSDITTADGKFLNPMRMQPGVDYSSFSKYKWPKECPSTHDWEVWTSFCSRITLPDGSLLRSLGKWKSISHRKWDWYYNTQADCIYCEDTTTRRTYIPMQSKRHRTRGSMHYTLHTVQPVPEGAPGIPIAVREIDTSTILRLASGPSLPVPTPVEDAGFWNFLRSWRGAWMWDNVHLPFGLDAVVDAVTNGTAVYVADGSYMRKLASDVDGAGWLIYCRRRRQIILKGSMAERNSMAGSYRGELLGLLAIHVWVTALEEYYGLPAGNRGTVACDNLGALNRCQKRRKKISPRSKHADILRVFRTLFRRSTGHFTYQHVYGHQDRNRTWNQLSLLEKLNCKCDDLAKAAVTSGIRSPPPDSIDGQLLPLESAAVFFNGGKLSSECGDEIRFQVDRSEARQFYITQLGWSCAAFDHVDWAARRRVLHHKPDMFRSWLFKQTSSFCATGRNMARWYDETVTECPNCGAPDEDSRHLLHCPDAGRFALFRERLKELEQWMSRPHTDPILADILSLYIFHRGSKTMASLCGRNREYLRLAHSQDFIGWDHFMEGKITKEFGSIQRAHLLEAPTMLTVADWINQFITHLLQITHGQWLYRNVSKHHQRYGQLKEVERSALLVEIDKLLHTSPDDVPEESRFLLEIDFTHLRQSQTDEQSYWVNAVKAAVTAGRRSARRERRLRRRSSDMEHARQGIHPILPVVPFGDTDDVEAFSNRHKRHRSGSIADKSNKRYKKPD